MNFCTQTGLDTKAKKETQSMPVQQVHEKFFTSMAMVETINCGLGCFIDGMSKYPRVSNTECINA